MNKKFAYTVKPRIMLRDWLCDYAKKLKKLLLSLTNICPSSQGKNEHFCVRQDKFALYFYIKTKIALLK